MIIIFKTMLSKENGKAHLIDITPGNKDSFVWPECLTQMREFSVMDIDHQALNNNDYVTLFDPRCEYYAFKNHD